MTDEKPAVEIRYCAYCGKPFEMEPGAPFWRRYCSDACKSKAYRERKRKAEIEKTPRPN